MSNNQPGSSAALGFVLDSPLQSWGVNSRFRRRGTNLHPSKSAILGLIAAALGIDKHSPREARHLQDLRLLRLTTCRVPRDANTRSPGPVRKLFDFHTVGGGYDVESESGRQSVPRKAAGGPFGTVVTQREYLVGVVFVAILEGKQAILESVATALRNPVWGVWLGRKCCLPATPIRGTVCANAQAALEECLEKLGFPISMLCEFDRCVEISQPEDTDPPLGMADVTMDDPVSYGMRQHVSRLTRYRRATTQD
jgi:CRISPR system Cascade subunit CasD